jgi:uncharacterized protein
MEIVIILTILFFSTLVRSTFGFGDALIAMPLLAIFLSVRIVTPLVALIAFTIAIYIVIQDFRKIEFKNIWKLIISSIIGIPIGLFYLKGVSEEIIKLILGIIIITFSIYNLLKPNIIKLKKPFWANIFGFLAGIIGAAYNTNGPIIVIYGTTQKWNPQEFRATLQGYFFTTGVFVIIGHLLAGNFKQEVMLYYLYALPLILLAIFFGGYMNKKINVEYFKNVIYIFLLITRTFI